MFGDCQVLSTLGGNASHIPSDSFFSSSTHNPNFTFMPNLPFNIFPPLIPKEENGKTKGKEEMMESVSGSEQVVEGVSGNEHEAEQLQHQQQQPPSKKKRYHRHTTRQIQEMEALFKECPHPDDKQRQKLSQELGLKPRQVKFWFQNRRTQMKAQQDRADNVVLRTENDNLKNENYRLQAALGNIMCPDCGGPAMLGEMGFDEQQIRLENARLKEEFERICMLVSQYSGRPLQSILPAGSFLPSSLDLDMTILPPKFETPLLESSGIIPTSFIHDDTNFAGGGVLIMEDEKPLAMELAITAVNELVKMCEMGEQLWTRNDGGKEVLNIEEYMTLFHWPVEQKPSPCELRTEATRHTAVVIMNSITLVDAFLDGNKWMELFPCIVSRAKTLQVVNSDVSGHPNGSLHLMYAEQQVASPLVPTREAHFLRFCHHNAEGGIWAVVDFPLDGFRNSFPQSFPFYRKRPSGCIIQDMPNGYSRVTWLEHVEVEENPIHEIFNQFVGSGLAFGARRWLAVLQRQCQRIASLMARNISDLGVIPSPEARKNLMNLSQRMIHTFSVNMSNSCGQSWTALSDSAVDTIRITTRKVLEPGEPNGLILTAVSTSWVPYNHVTVFDLLRDERRRTQLDVLSNGNSLHEVAHIANGSHPGNCVSLLRINVASNSSQRVELMLQESCTDESGSIVVYTTIDIDSIQQAMNGDDISCIPLLPLGFVIHPMPQHTNYDPDTSEIGNIETTLKSECLLTVGLQVLASTIPSAKLNLSSVTAVNNHLCNTVQQITAVLSHGNDAILPENVGMIVASPTVPSAAITAHADHFPSPQSF